MSSQERSLKLPERFPAVAAVALVLGALAWFFLVRDPGTDSTEAHKSVSVVPAAGVAKAVAPAGYPVYWAGERPDSRYEVTLISDGRAYLRYLPARAADRTGEFLTIGSYSQKNAAAVLPGLAARSGAKVLKVPGGGVAMPVASSHAPGTGWYVAYPGVDVQIEVFDPTHGRAIKLIRSGLLQPVTAGSVR